MSYQQEEGHATPPRQYTLQAGKIGAEEYIQISAVAIQQSLTLKNMIEMLNLNEVIPIENIDAKTLRKVVQFCEHHAGEPIPVPKSNASDTVIPDWDADFLKVTNAELFFLMNAADYLHIDLLMQYIGKKVALTAEGKSPMGISKMWKIPTDEQEKEAREAANVKRILADTVEKAAKKTVTGEQQGSGVSSSLEQ
ncbi:hypothetical protein CRE_02896 [Caenorhabditis remanei]|uniref:Skp1-related protein n=1 Tax=Caenorhabditis remanei TaxID=31234 RepID=E3LWJ1_CAERE|nr:hypothetical protein CRE_02896 [Caenorhabditis remanei]